AVADWMNVPVLQHDYSSYQTVRAGVKHPSLAPYGAYRCSDGKDVIFSVQNDREWVNFCEKFLKRPELTRALGFADNMERLGHREELDEIVERRFSKLSSHEAMQELEAAGLAYGRLNEVADISRHPHVRRVEIGTPEGTIETIAPAAIFNSERPSLRPVPGLGAHTEAVREEVRAGLRARAASA
ncbi:MAG: CoA transferase, partial [Mesorhizobium sp.]|uniref:CoA transferase n=1 Tax=Mesorhizobium sp. TaxID=1871066 RepID=UPI0012278B03